MDYINHFLVLKSQENDFSIHLLKFEIQTGSNHEYNSIDYRPYYLIQYLDFIDIFSVLKALHY